MALENVAQSELRAEVKQKLLMVKVRESLSYQKMADSLGVSRQALHLYIKMKTTPRSYVLYNACKTWGIEFEIAGQKFGIKDFESAADKPQRDAEPIQLDLIHALSSLRDESMKIEVKKQVGTDLELKLLIRFVS